MLGNNETQKSCGVDWIDLLDRKQLRKHFPWLNMENIEIGSFSSKNEGYFDPWMFVHAMKNKCVAMGVHYAEGHVCGAKVEPVSSGSSAYHISSVNVAGSKHWGPDGSSISAPVFVNAAGAWSGKLVQDFASALHKPASVAALPVKPRKRCIFSVHCPGTQVNLLPDSYPVPSGSTPLVVDPSGVYFRPEGRGAGRFICGVSPPEENDPDCDVSTDHGRAALSEVDYSLFEDIIWPVLGNRVPAFEELKVISSWAGFYDYNTLDQVRSCLFLKTCSAVFCFIYPSSGSLIFVCCVL
jgi:FAD-dependent oxidoreductase domain-containing protein 1